MPKRFLCCAKLCLVAMLVATVSTAQDRSEDAAPATPRRDSGFHLGFTAGPEFSHVDIKLDDGERSLDLVMGFHLGVALAWRSGPFVIRSGVNFINAGALFNGSRAFAADEFNVNFVAIPLDLRLAPVTRGVVRPYIFAGPEVRYVVDLKEERISLRDDVRMLDATFSVGVGISLRAGWFPIRFSPEIRYVRDLFGIYNGGLQTDDGGIVETAETVKANALRIGVLLGF